MKEAQETWMAEAAELVRLRTEVKQIRELLVACEAREWHKSHELELLQRDVSQLQEVQEQLREAGQRICEYECREFEFERAKRETEILQNEKQTMQTKLSRRDQDSERLKHAYTSRTAELEARVQSSGDHSSGLRLSSQAPSQDTQMLMQRAVADSQAKIAQLKKAHSRLLENLTDLELEYQSVKSRLDAMQGHSDGHTLFHETNPNEQYHPSTGGAYADRSGSGGEMTAADSGYDTYSEYQHPTLHPMNRRFQPPINPQQGQKTDGLPSPQAAAPGTPGLSWKPTISRAESMVSRSSSAIGTHAPGMAFNQTAPLIEEEDEGVKSGSKSGFNDTSSDLSGQVKKDKITPNSEVRYYGRGKLRF
jgi:hypothetical protein